MLEKQRAVTELFVLKGKLLINIFKRSEKIKENAAIEYSNDKKWGSRI